MSSWKQAPLRQTPQQNAKFQMRMTEEQRIALDEAARRNGFRDAKELVMFRLEQDLIAASLAAAS